MANSSLKIWLTAGGLSFLLLGFFLVVSQQGCGDLTGDVASLTVSPSTKTIGINQSQVFSAYGADALGNNVAVSVTWSLEGSMGTISSNGLFIANGTAGSGKVVAITSTTVSAKATVVVTYEGWIAGQVKDELGKNVASVKIYIPGTSLQAFADSGGEYSISQIPQGTYEVWATDPRSIYKDASLEASVASGETVRVDFTLYYYNKPTDITTPTIAF